MKYATILVCLFFVLSVFSFNQPDPLKTYEWAVIGAGPAGVTAVAVLLKEKVPDSEILWIDPEFKVGRMGKFYNNVPGNLQTKRLVTYANNCPFFKDFSSAARESLYTYDQEAFQPLHIMVEPVLEFTHYLRNRVVSTVDSISALNYMHNAWNLNSINHHYKARKVILAIGAHPKRLDYPLTEIPMDLAIDKEKLAQLITPEDTIAVFGSMHSALLIIKYLTELPVKKIINVYQSNYFFGRPGTAGLEGITAAWVKNILEKNPPSHLTRIQSNSEHLGSILSTCTKVIYAIGYEPNTILINGKTDYIFNEETGNINNDLFGIGIAFAPTAIEESNGKRVGLNGFNTYLWYAQKLIPEWINA